jgi:acyl dehydratase
MRPGQQIPPHRVRVRREGMKVVAALMRDPNPIHWDVEALRALGMDERPVNQGPVNVAYVWDMLASFAGGVENVRELTVRFVSNALADESLTAVGTVEAVEDGMAVCAVRLERPGGERVLDGVASIVAR